MSESPFKHAKAEDSAGFLLWKLTTMWQQKLSHIFNELGITHTQFVILASLRWFDTQQQTISQSVLATHTAIDKMTLSKSIRSLERSELVLRTASKTDSRAINVTLSALGKNTAEKAIVAIENADHSFFACLAPTTLEEYKRLVCQLIQGNREP